MTLVRRHKDKSDVDTLVCCLDILPIIDLKTFNTNHQPGDLTIGKTKNADESQQLVIA